jgi:hypothetical protein
MESTFKAEALHKIIMKQVCRLYYLLGTSHYIVKIYGCDYRRCMDWMNWIY